MTGSQETRLKHESEQDSEMKMRKSPEEVIPDSRFHTENIHKDSPRIRNAETFLQENGDSLKRQN